MVGNGEVSLKGKTVEKENTDRKVEWKVQAAEKAQAKFTFEVSRQAIVVCQAWVGSCAMHLQKPLKK